MKIKTTTTEIECTAEEIRQSNNLADGIYNLLRGVFNGTAGYEESEKYEEQEEEEQEE